MKRVFVMALIAVSCCAQLSAASVTIQVPGGFGFTAVTHRVSYDVKAHHTAGAIVAQLLKDNYYHLGEYYRPEHYNGVLVKSVTGQEEYVFLDPHEQVGAVGPNTHFVIINESDSDAEKSHDERREKIRLRLGKKVPAKVFFMHSLIAPEGFEFEVEVSTGRTYQQVVDRVVHLLRLKVRNGLHWYLDPTIMGIATQPPHYALQTKNSHYTITANELLNRAVDGDELTWTLMYEHPALVSLWRDSWVLWNQKESLSRDEVDNLLGRLEGFDQSNLNDVELKKLNDLMYRFKGMLPEEKLQRVADAIETGRFTKLNNALKNAQTQRLELTDDELAAYDNELDALKATLQEKIRGNAALRNAIHSGASKYFAKFFGSKFHEILWNNPRQKYPSRGQVSQYLKDNPAIARRYLKEMLFWKDMMPAGQTHNTLDVEFKQVTGMARKAGFTRERLAAEAAAAAAPVVNAPPAEIDPLIGDDVLSPDDADSGGEDAPGFIVDEPVMPGFAEPAVDPEDPTVPAGQRHIGGKGRSGGGGIGASQAIPAFLVAAAIGSYVWYRWQKRKKKKEKQKPKPPLGTKPSSQQQFTF